jgi:hypothetical protein
MKPNNQEDQYDIGPMLAVIEDCIKKDQLEFLAHIICKIQKEYQEVCELASDGEYQVSWTHRQVLDYLTYQQKY